MKKWKWTLMGLTLLIALVAYGANVKDNFLNIGDDNNSTNKSINMGAGVLRWDGGSQKMRFSNDDGGVFQDVGGGGGGGSAGVNILVNPDLENGSISGWNNTGGGTLVLTTATSEVAFGGFALSYNASAASDDVVSDQVDVPEGLFGANCLARIFYKGGDANLKLQAINGSLVVLQEQILSTSAEYRTESVSFICPSSGTIALRIIATADAANIFLDNLHQGENFLIGTVAQAELFLYAFYPVASNCIWIRTDTSFGAFSTDSDCVSVSVVTDLQGTLDTSDNDLPDLQFNTPLPPGNYIIAAHFTGSNSVSEAELGFRIASPGFGNGTQCGQQLTGTGQTGHVTCSMNLTVTGVGPTSFNMEGRASSGDVSLFNRPNMGELTWKIERFPSTVQQVLRPEQIAWHVDAEQGGATVSLGVANVASYVNITNGSLTTVARTGSIPVLQSCSGAEEASGSTCSGDEAVGISFTAPAAGKVLACATFSYGGHSSTASSVTPVFKIAETSNTAQVEIQFGGTALSSGGVSSTPTTNTVDGIRLCGTFTFANAGKKTLRVLYVQNVTGTPVSSDLFITQTGGSAGGRNMHWEVYPFRSFIQAPLIVNHVSTDASAGMLITNARVVCSAGSSIATQSGDWLASIGNVSAGCCTLTFKAGLFNNVPVCTATLETGTPFFSTLGTASTSLVIICGFSDGGTPAVAATHTIICTAVK